MLKGIHSIEIVDLLGQFPIFSAVIENLDFWDLIQLSRTSTTVRDLCHGFTHGNLDQPEYVVGSRNSIRTSLCIGDHRTTSWRLYKRLTLKHCRELGHVRGTNPSGCKLCSKPVCLGCIVKHSFGKRENTYVLRGRLLCEQCFKDGNPHTEHINVKGSSKLKIPYSKAGLCMCTAQEGILCLDCKEKQNEDSVHQFKTVCAGTGCGQTLKDPFASARICLWCNSLLPNASQRKHYHEEINGFADMQSVLLQHRPRRSQSKWSGFNWFPKPDFDRQRSQESSLDIDQPAMPAVPIASTS